MNSINIVLPSDSITREVFIVPRVGEFIFYRNQQYFVTRIIHSFPSYRKDTSGYSITVYAE